MLKIFHVGYTTVTQNDLTQKNHECSQSEFQLGLKDTQPQLY
jgi:hypothetical protein